MNLMPEKEYIVNGFISLENIPLSDTELASLQKKLKEEKKIPLICGLCVLPVMAFVCWLIRGNFARFKYYDFLLLGTATIFSFGFIYLIGWLVVKYNSYNLRKDMAKGKSVLTSVIIGRDKTEYGEYFTFEGQQKNDKIRIQVKPEDYKRYQSGAKVVIEYLQFSKVALLIIDAQ